MAKARMGAGLVAGCLLLWGGAAPALAQPSVAQTLSYRPKQEGVVYSIPTPQEQASCKVEPVKTSRGIIGWLLRDGKGQPLRRYIDSNGDKKIDTWAYYKDGVEVYRELDTNGNDRADQYRWLNSGGMKWGLDVNEDGKIDSWKIIAADETALEVYQAVVSKDFNRLRALFITETELQGMRLPAAMVSRIREQLRQAPAKFDKLVKEMPAVADATQPGRVESAPPQCLPTDTSGAEQDLFRYSSRTIMFDKSNKEPEWLQSGEMLKVGLAWRLVDAPALGLEGPDLPQPSGDSPELRKLKEILAKVDDQNKDVPLVPNGPDARIVKYNLQRAEVIEKILSLKDLSSENRENFSKQMAENLSTATIASAADDNTSMQKLVRFKEQVPAGSNLASYVTFRILWADFSQKMGEGKEQGKIQAKWLEDLTKFVQSYPKADDTPDALTYLAMGSEFLGKDEEAKRWYQQLVNSFPEHPSAPKAKGAIARLSLLGNPMELSGKTMAGSQFDLSSLNGKVVVVYYWASYCRDCSRDLEELKKLHGSYSSKGFEVVTVNLDDKTEDGAKVMQSVGVPGTHLYQPGENTGLSGPLGLQYGIMTLPSTFLIGKDGKVINRNIQIGDLNDALQKAL